MTIINDNTRDMLYAYRYFIRGCVSWWCCMAGPQLVVVFVKGPDWLNVAVFAAMTFYALYVQMWIRRAEYIAPRYYYFRKAGKLEFSRKRSTKVCHVLLSYNVSVDMHVYRKDHVEAKLTEPNLLPLESVEIDEDVRQIWRSRVFMLFQKFGMMAPHGIIARKFLKLIKAA